jgi:hypothetical protein
LLPIARLDVELTTGHPMLIEGYGDSEASAVELFYAHAPFQRRNDHELLVGTAGTASACDGDSGGPAYLEAADGLFVVGITSRRPLDETARCRNGTVDTLAPAYAAWIGSVASDLLPTPDGGPPSDGGMAPAPASGCSCRAGGNRRAPSSAIVLGALCLVLGRRADRKRGAGVRGASH